MVNFMMAVNRYCSDCMKEGQFLPLRFVMVNIHSGMWMCPKDECIFPMNSHLMKDYMEDNLTTEKVLQLTRKGRRRKSGELKPPSQVTKESLQSLQSTSTSLTQTSDDGGSSSRLTSSLLSNKHSGASSTSSLTTQSVSSSSTLNLVGATLYPLWENTNLLCWLDAAMAMIVLNASMEHIVNEEQCLIGHLYTEYKRVLVSFNQILEYKMVREQLERLRNNMLKFLQPKLTAYNDEDSPLVCLPLVLRTSKVLTQALEVDYKCVFKCEQCAFERTDGFKKIVMSLPNTSADLNFNDNICYYRPCYKCFSGQQKTKYVIERYPSVMFVHFPHGVQTRKFWRDFSFTTNEGDEYMVTQIIQYLPKKRHFILWSYEYQDELWCEVDDLNDPVVAHKHKRPRCKPHEVHLIIWERVAFLKSLPVRTKTFDDDLNSPKGISPASSAISIRVSPNRLPSEVSPLASRVCSTRTSLSSGDDVTSAHCSGTLPTVTTRRPGKDVKGLRNTPRYEPYISRKNRTDVKTGGASAGITSAFGGKGKSKLSSEKSKVLSVSDVVENKKVSDIIVPETKELYLTDSGMENKKVPVSDVQVIKKTSIDMNNKPNLDFLKGVLSDELSSFEDLLTKPNVSSSTAVTSKTSKPSESSAEEELAAPALQSLTDLYDILEH